MVLIGPVMAGMVRYGLVWSAMIPYGPVWSHLVPYGTVWSYKVQYGPVWSYMIKYGPYGPVTPCMILDGPVRYCMVPYSITRSRRVPLFWPKMLSCLTKEQILTLLNFVCLCSTHTTSAQILCLLSKITLLVAFPFSWWLPMKNNQLFVVDHSSALPRFSGPLCLLTDFQGMPIKLRNPLLLNFLKFDQSWPFW